jgi:acetyltransferase-like isoleucine patch superfamily enzyme
MNRFIIKTLNWVISKLKNEHFSLSDKIPLGYLLLFFFNKSISLIRGRIFFPFSNNLVFVDRHTTLKARRLFKFKKNLQIGIGCYIDALSCDGIVIGNNVSIGKYTTIECSGTLQNLGIGINIGDYSSLGSHGFFGCAGGITIGSNTIMGNYVSFHSENHNYKFESIPIRLQGVTRKGISIGDNCWIGSKVTILDGVNIPSGCIIAAGSVVLPSEYSENAIYGGVPARFLKSRISSEK